MIDKRVHTVEEALAGIGDGASIMMSGFGSAGYAHHLILGIAALGLSGLTVITNSSRRIDTIAPEILGGGQATKVITTAARGGDKEPSPFEQAVNEGRVELEMVPQGTFAERIRAGGAGIPAFYTPTAAETPLAEGREVRDFDGRPCLLETALTADVAIMRAHVADRWGNVIFDGTQGNFGTAMAAASKLTIVEVAEISDTPLPPNHVEIPAAYVQRVIALEDPR